MRSTFALGLFSGSEADIRGPKTPGYGIIRMNRFGIFVFGLFLMSMSIAAGQSKAFHLSAERMGSTFVYTIESRDSVSALAALKAADQEVMRIEALISSWQPSSETSEVNGQAGIQPVTVSQELFQLLTRAIKVADLTGGSFDPSYAGLDRIWTFDSTMTELPDSAEVALSVQKIDYQSIVLQEDKLTVFLPDSGMKIGFGAIGKGYAADKAKQVLIEQGIESGVVNAGGDLICWGERAQGEAWQVSIADPVQPNRILATLPVRDLAVVTSGNYERFVYLNGERYSHILDPRTGWPVRGIRSVTVLSPIAEFSDALATALFVLGEKQALSLVNQLSGVECLIITEDNRMINSNGLNLQPVRSGDEEVDFLFQIGGE